MRGSVRHVRGFSAGDNHDKAILSQRLTRSAVWWYSRVGEHKNIPPREHGGTYTWKRLTPIPGH